MSTNELVGGIRIYLDSIETENANIGLYTTAEDMSANAAADQADIAVDDGGAFAAGDLVYVSDSVSNEWGVVDSIATNTNTLTLRVDLTNSYTTGNSGKVESSQFRWIENDVPGTDLVWKSGMLLTGGVPETVEKIDSYRGGNYVTLDKMALGLDNTSSFFATLEGSDIYLDGLRAEVVEFTVDAGSGVVTQRVQFRGKADVTKWGVGNYDLNIEPSLLGRGSSLTKPVDTQDYPNAADSDVGKAVPVTMGTFDAGRYAKMTRVSSAQTVLGGYDFLTYMLDNTDLTLDSININDVVILMSSKMYPLISQGAAPTITYALKLAPTIIINAFTTYNPTDLFLRVVDDVSGNSSADGDTRRVLAVSYADATTITFTTDSVFSDELTDDTSGDGTWLQIISIDYSFAADTRDLGGFLDVGGAVIPSAADNGLLLYTYDEPKSVDVVGDGTFIVQDRTVGYYLIPDYSYKIDSATSNNLVKILPQAFNRGIDTLTSLRTLPITDLQTYKKDTLADYGASNYENIGNGIYTNSGSPISDTYILGDLEDTYDKNPDSGIQLHCALPRDTASVNWVYQITLPTRPEKYDFDRTLILLRASEGSGAPVSRTVQTRRWFGGLVTQATYANGAYDTIINFPNSYYSIAPGFDDKWWWYYTNQTGGTPPFSSAVVVAGYLNSAFTLSGMGTAEGYDSVSECILRFRESVDHSSVPGVINDYLNEVAIGFEKDLSIKEALYVELLGRIFNDTWGGRKTPEDLIENPVDQYEHICRLQNWSQEGDSATEAGLAYSDAALIDTSSDLGGFDFPPLDTLKDRRFSFQLTEMEKVYTPTLKRNFCRSMWCAGYVDEDGKESLAFLPKLDSSTITDTITLADVPDGLRPSPVEEPQAQNAFAEPFVRYAWNQGSKKFDGWIGFKNIQKGVWQQSYTPGFEGAEGEEMYDYLHENVWKRFREVTPAPSDMTDQYFISTYEDAKWFLTEWIDWMLLKRITVPVYYTKANTWHIGRHTYLNLPHQTAGAAQEVVIEGIAKNINAGVCTLDLVMLDRIPPSYYFRDVMFNAAGGADADWVDTTTEYGGSNDKIDTM